jgi:hypothetical protein
MIDVVPRRLKLPSKPLGAKTNGFKNKKKDQHMFYRWREIELRVLLRGPKESFSMQIDINIGFLVRQASI